MTSIDEQLKKVVPENKIYTSKLVVHLDWHAGSFHLIIASSIMQKRFPLLNEHDDLDLKSFGGEIILLRSCEKRTGT